MCSTWAGSYGAPTLATAATVSHAWAPAIAAAPPKEPVAAPAAAKSAPPPKGKAPKQDRAKPVDAGRPLRAELKRIDERMGRLATEKGELETKLAAPGAAPASFADLGRQLAHVGAEIATLEERWLELQTELEAAG